MKTTREIIDSVDWDSDVEMQRLDDEWFSKEEVENKLKEERERVEKIIVPVINEWYGKRMGTEQRALNEFVQRHMIDNLIKKLKQKLKEQDLLTKEWDNKEDDRWN